MNVHEARRILFAASTMWASAQMEFVTHVFEVPSYEKQLTEEDPNKKRIDELNLRAEVLDAAVEQYAKVLIEGDQSDVNISYMPARCPVCDSIGARAWMLDHIELEHPGKLTQETPSP